MGDNKSEKFFKVFYDRMRTAQLDVKATTSVNVGEMSHKAKDEKDLEPGEKAQKLCFIERSQLKNMSFKITDFIYIA